MATSLQADSVIRLNQKDDLKLEKTNNMLAEKLGAIVGPTYVAGRVFIISRSARRERVWISDFERSDFASSQLQIESELLLKFSNEIGLSHCKLQLSARVPLSSNRENCKLHFRGGAGGLGRVQQSCSVRKYHWATLPDQLPLSSYFIIERSGGSNGDCSQLRLSESTKQRRVAMSEYLYLRRNQIFAAGITSMPTLLRLRRSQPIK